MNNFNSILVTNGAEAKPPRMKLLFETNINCTRNRQIDQNRCVIYCGIDDIKPNAFGSRVQRTESGNLIETTENVDIDVERANERTEDNKTREKKNKKTRKKEREKEMKRAIDW